MSVVSLVIRRAARDNASPLSEASLTLRPSSSLEALKVAVRQAFAPELDGQVRRELRFFFFVCFDLFDRACLCFLVPFLAPSLSLEEKNEEFSPRKL